MIIVLTGGTGFIGQSLIKKLKDQNHTIHLLIRSPSTKKNYQCKTFLWPNIHSPIPLEAFPIDSKFGVIHLAGEPILQWPWTSHKKRKIYNSRVTGTKKLIETLQNLKNTPQFFFCASAIGIYGRQDSKNITEIFNFQKQDFFLQKVCEDWEREALKLKQKCRVVIFRLGIVLSFQGGFLKEQLRWSKLFVPFLLYKHKLWISWIHREDLVRLILWAINKKETKGIYNATAPDPFDMNFFLNRLSIYLKKKYLRIPIPLFLMKLFGGELVKNLLISCHVTSEKLTREGFQFKYKNLVEVFK